jgi:hypothetical protein
MAVDQQTPARHAVRRSSRPVIEPVTSGGTRGNERLTAATGATLLVLLAVIGITIIQLRQLLWLHLFVGMLLIGPVALKLASTGYRFVRYYSGDAQYRRKGPPPAALRVIAPMVIISTLVVLASGVALLFAGPASRDSLLPLHKVSFIVWGAFIGIHVLAHLPRVGQALRGDYSRAARLGGDVTGRTGRTIALAGAVTAGVVLALLVIPEFGPWLHSSALFHHHG